MGSATRQRPQAKAQANKEIEQFVQSEVLRKLGKPENLFRIDARNVWGNHYRVNVFCTVGKTGPFASVTLTDSFFVTVTPEGISSEPAIEKKYGNAQLAV